MKKYLIPLIVLVFLTGTSCEEKIDIEQEKKAIISVIKEETNAFLSRDFERLAANYVQDETNIRLAASKSGYTYYVGWEDLGAAFKEYFENNPDPSTNKYVKTDYKVKVYKESAWAINNETVYDSEGEISSKMIVVRFLEKVDGEWKIVYLSTVNTTSYEEIIEEGEEESETE